MKRIIRFVLCLIFGAGVVLGFAMSIGYGEGNIGGDIFPELMNTSANTLFLDDGRMLFAISPEEDNERRLITEIKCVDAMGSELWTYPMPFEMHRALIDLEQIDNRLFMITGKGADDHWHILSLDQEGTYQNEWTLPDHSYTPKVASNGIFYTTASKNPGLWKMDQNGQSTMYQIEEAKNLNICRVTVEGKKTYLSIFYRNKDERLITSIVCLNEFAVEWKHDIGDFEHWSARQWTNNDRGGITVIAEYRDTSSEEWHGKICFICFDSNGEIVCESEAPDPYGFTPHVMAHTEEGNYNVWGSICVVPVQSRYRGLLLTFDKYGNILHRELKSVQGDCHRYIEGEVYAVVFADADMSALYIVPFDDLDSESLPSDMFPNR
jgi:hypothetical protein